MRVCVYVYTCAFRFLLFQFRGTNNGLRVCKINWKMVWQEGLLLVYGFQRTRLVFVCSSFFDCFWQNKKHDFFRAFCAFFVHIFAFFWSERFWISLFCCLFVDYLLSVSAAITKKNRNKAAYVYVKTVVMAF